LDFAGTATTGWDITMTSSISGAGTETVSISPGFTGYNNVFAGYEAGYGTGLTTARNLVVIGGHAAPFITSAQQGVAVGELAAHNAESDFQFTIVGQGAGYNLNGNTYNDTFYGYQAGYGVTTGKNDVIIGPEDYGSSFTNCITTGSNSIEIGTDACAPSSTANGDLSIQNIIYGVGNMGGGSTISTGKIAIGTTTPYSRLTVWGPGNTGSTSAFLVANSASTTEFSVFDNGNATLAGTLTQNSDYRLKQDITPLGASSTLSAITSLTPVSFIWRNASEGSTTQFGLIAQDVQKIFPNLVSTTSATALTPGGTLGVNYIGLIAPAIEAIKELAAQVRGFAQSITTNVLTAVTGNFTQVRAQDVQTQDVQAQGVKTQNLCLGSTCITESQLKSILSNSNRAASSLAGRSGGSPSHPSLDPTATSTASTSPANVEHATSTPAAATSTQPTTKPVAPPPRVASTTSPTTSSSTASH
jgi:hypothetical protein